MTAVNCSVRVSYLFSSLSSDNKERCERCSTSPTELFNVTAEPVCGNHVDDPCPGQCDGSD